MVLAAASDFSKCCLSSPFSEDIKYSATTQISAVFPLWRATQCHGYSSAWSCDRSLQNSSEICSLPWTVRQMSAVCGPRMQSKFCPEHNIPPYLQVSEEEDRTGMERVGQGKRSGMETRAGQEDMTGREDKAGGQDGRTWQENSTGKDRRTGQIGWTGGQKKLCMSVWFIKVSERLRRRPGPRRGGQVARSVPCPLRRAVVCWRVKAARS